MILVAGGVEGQPPPPVEDFTVGETLTRTDRLPDRTELLTKKDATTWSHTIYENGIFRSLTTYRAKELLRNGEITGATWTYPSSDQGFKIDPDTGILIPTEDVTPAPAAPGAPAAAPTPAPTPVTSSIPGIQKRLEEVDKAFENVRKKDTEIQEKISGAGGDQAALQKKMNDLEKEKANAATSPDRKTDIDKELQTLKENKAALEKLESERNTAQQEAQRLSDEALKAAEELQRKEKDAYDKFVKANPGKPSYQQEKNKYEAERLLAEARIKDIQTRRTPLENEIRDLERQKASAKTDEEKNKIQQQIDAKKTDLAPMISEQNKYQADVRDAAAKKANAEFREETFIRQAVSGGRALLKSYEMFSGIARLGSLFLTGKNWEEWRKKVDDAFCKSILFGGTKCWQSKICEKYIDTTPGGNSLIARTARGAPTGAAHLAVEKSLPIDFAEEGTGYLYKISYTVTNPNDRNMNYNIKFSSTTKTVKVFQPDKELAPGTSDGKVSSAMLYKKSFRDYTQACLTFNPSIRTWDGRSVGEYCIPISQYKGAATQPFTNLQQAEGTCDDGVQNQRETSTDCGGPCPTCGTTERPKEFEDF